MVEARLKAEFGVGNGSGDNNANENELNLALGPMESIQQLYNYANEYELDFSNHKLECAKVMKMNKELAKQNGDVEGSSGCESSGDGKKSPKNKNSKKKKELTN